MAAGPRHRTQRSYQLQKCCKMPTHKSMLWWESTLTRTRETPLFSEWNGTRWGRDEDETRTRWGRDEMRTRWGWDEDGTRWGRDDYETRTRRGQDEDDDEDDNEVKVRDKTRMRMRTRSSSIPTLFGSPKSASHVSNSCIFVNQYVLHILTCNRGKSIYLNIPYHVHDLIYSASGISSWDRCWNVIFAHTLSKSIIVQVQVQVCEVYRVWFLKLCISYWY